MVLGALLTLFVSEAAMAQPPPGPPRDRGGGYPSRDTPEGRQRRLDRASAFLEQMDTNHNGQIDADEAMGPRKGYLDRLLERADMKATFPVPLKQLRDGMQRYYAQESPRDAGSGRPQSPPSGSPTPSQPPKSGSSGSSTPVATTSSVAGFGVSAKPSTGGSFGATTQTTMSSSGSSSGSPSSGSPSVADRIRGYAANLVRQYDTDKNGSLEKEEWSQMSTDPKDADRNHDGHITLDELATWLLAYSQGRSTSNGGSSSGSKLAANTTSAGKRSYRFLSPAERLPKGLPDWFAQKDANGDGQVSMAEYSTTWTEEAAAEFAKYDRNNDGVITAEECLKALKK